MFSSSAPSLSLTICLALSAASHALLEITNATHSLHNAIVQQNFLIVPPPLPILEIGYMHMISQIGVNATKAENETIQAMGMQSKQSSVTTSLHARAAATDCGPGNPCVDGSCCNSVS